LLLFINFNCKIDAGEALIEPPFIGGTWHDQEPSVCRNTGQQKKFVEEADAG
jgi:hypothetical protein